MTKPRLYMVRGSTQPIVLGREVERHGDQLTLNVAPVDWPFPRLKTFDRAQVVYVDGPPEPVAHTVPLLDGD
ncbi:hypothetical protein [Methylibium petroleiphilum]